MRSSVTMTRPRVDRRVARGLVLSRVRPQSKTSPPRRSCPHAPKMCMSVSERPEPMRPPIPNTSPARTSKLMSWRRSGMALPVRNGEIFDRQQCVTGTGLTPWKKILDGTAHHVADHLAGVCFCGVECGDRLAVAQHGDAVADREHLLELVRDVDRGDALVAEAADDPEQDLDLRLGERSGRLVEDEDAAFFVSAFTISTSCWRPVPRSPTRAAGSMLSLKRFRSCAASV